MLKSIFVACLVILGLNLSAQEKGQLVTGGGLLFQSLNDDSNGITEKTRKLSVSPMFGLMVSKNIATGILLDYQINTQERSDANFKTYEETFSMFVGAFGRYHGKFTEKMLYTGQLYAGKTFLLKDISSNKLESFSTGLEVGLMYFIAKKAALGINVVSIKYQMQKDIDIDLDKSEFVIDYNVFNPRLTVLFYI